MLVMARMRGPCTLAQTSQSWRWWLRRPGWTYFLREITNSYSFRRRHLYVSDGGHWENLGLVELLRRGCTEIVCVNAGGDNQDSFGTIAEAIALAPEELGVEIELDPTPLRPPRKASDRPGAPELRRTGGTIRYPHGRAEGPIWLIEPALTEESRGSSV